MKLTALAAVLLLACASVPAVAPAPVNIVVIAGRAESADAARLQALVERSVRGAPAPLTVTIHYYGAANARVLPPLHIGRGYPNRLVFGSFTITDRAGRVLDSQSWGYTPPTERLKALHDAAELIAKRVAALSGS